MATRAPRVNASVLERPGSNMNTKHCPRCERLDEENERLRQELARVAPDSNVPNIPGLGPTQTAIAKQLLETGAVSYALVDAICTQWGHDRDDPADPKRIHVRMCRVRRWLSCLGLDVVTTYRWGYALTDKAAGRRLLQRWRADWHSVHTEALARGYYPRARSEKMCEQPRQ